MTGSRTGGTGRERIEDRSDGRRRGHRAAVPVTSSRVDDLTGGYRDDIIRYIPNVFALRCACGPTQCRPGRRSWAIDPDSVHRYRILRPRRGRPLSQRAAWQRLLDAEPPANIDEAIDLARLVRRRSRNERVRILPALESCIVEEPIEFDDEFVPPIVAVLDLLDAAETRAAAEALRVLR